MAAGTDTGMGRADMEDTDTHLSPHVVEGICLHLHLVVVIAKTLVVTGNHLATNSTVVAAPPDTDMDPAPHLDEDISSLLITLLQRMLSLIQGLVTFLLSISLRHLTVLLALTDEMEADVDIAEAAVVTVEDIAVEEDIVVVEDMEDIEVDIPEEEVLGNVVNSVTS